MTPKQTQLQFSDVDRKRMGKILKAVHEVMADGQWWTLAEIQTSVRIWAGRSAMETTISARLRDLRKAEYGGYDVQRRKRESSPDGLYEYRVIAK